MACYIVLQKQEVHEHHFHDSYVLGRLQPNPFYLRHSTEIVKKAGVQTIVKTNPGSGRYGMF